MVMIYFIIIFPVGTGKQSSGGVIYEGKKQKEISENPVFDGSADSSDPGSRAFFGGKGSKTGEGTHSDR